MDFRPGERVGVFEILGPLGAGGMGEVYRARDTRLGRDVALKVLPRSVGQDAESLARFNREARLLAALNHPGIAAIYGVEDSPRGPLLVLELVPGDTLADQIKRGPLPLMEALSICRQIADAVAFAHATGVVHRDLKPANVKCLPNGGVKVLDFGLAKALAPDSGPVSPDELTTMAAETIGGTILGTPDYMSPEQARAQPVDRRTDVWALGCILFEMLTGRRPFQRQTVPDTLAAVLGHEPDWSALPATTPPSIRTLLRRCLQRDRDRRLHDMADVRIELEEALASVGAGDTSGGHPPSAKLQPLEIGALGVMALGALVSSLFLYRLVPVLAGLYTDFGMSFSLPLRIYIRTCNLSVIVVPVLVALWGGFTLAGRPLPPTIRRAVLVAVAAVGGAATVAGVYFVAEDGLLQATRLSLGWRTQVVDRDLGALYLVSGEPARVVALIEPRIAPGGDASRVGWGTAGQAFQLAEAYRAQGNVEAARRLYRRAQEAALAFDEVLSQQALIEQDRWQTRLGVNFADWRLPIADLRRLPDLIRTVSQQRLDELARDDASKRP